MNTQDKLYVAIELYGLNDERTLKISQEREKEIIQEMNEVYGVK